jgi:hypothetical protein
MSNTRRSASHQPEVEERLSAGSKRTTRRAMESAKATTSAVPPTPSDGLPSRIRTSLCLARSLFVGNGILRPETKAPKWPLESTWPLAETTHQHASPPIRGFSPKAGKSPLDADCVVGPGGLQYSNKFNGLSCPTLLRRSTEFQGLFSRLSHHPRIFIAGLFANQFQWDYLSELWRRKLAEPSPGKEAIKRFHIFDCQGFKVRTLPGRGSSGRRAHGDLIPPVMLCFEGTDALSRVAQCGSTVLSLKQSGGAILV